tara:strand:+ start:50115 stop:51161 length:1047 start_codon:yes stop_codon:yes gene_type:complete
MIKDKLTYSILIIEDNPGDLFIFQEYLRDQILNPSIHTALNFKEAETMLSSNEINFDIIFLDLSLPDKKGVELIHEIVRLSHQTPIVVLTGYSDIQFGIKSLHLGVSDYLIKDEITSLTLYKSLRYNIERGKYIIQLEQSEKRYMDLFHLSPQPMWIYDIDTLCFLDINNAAIEHYGFSYEEFLAMCITDIRPKEDVNLMMEVVNATKKKRDRKYNGFFKHQKKNGEIITVEITSNLFAHNGKTVRIILANDITERLEYVKAIVDQNKNLKEIAWVQSHVVRAPLARMMGLIKVLQNNTDEVSHDNDFLFDELLKSADELDVIIREISDKASKIEINNRKYDLGNITS